MERFVHASADRIFVQVGRMITLGSSHSGPGLPGLSGALRGLAIVAGMTLLLGACGKGQNPAASKAHAIVHAKPAASAPAALPASAPATASSAQVRVAAQSKLAGMSVADLLTAAREAYAQHRLIAPAGDNAMEYYEAVLARDPKNQVARDALRETFPFSVPDVEKSISQNDFAEANREIDVLSKADPTNYTLTLLRSKLDAQQKLQARQQLEAQQKAQQKAKEAQELAAVQKAAAAKAAADKEAAAKLAEQKEDQAQATPVAKTAPPPPPKPEGVTRGARVLQAIAAQYPVEAARNQTSGYAVVQFVVTAAGDVTDVHIVSSSPRHVFDQAAIRAVEQSKYQPALKDGDPVSAVLQRRLDFKFGG